MSRSRTALVLTATTLGLVLVAPTTAVAAPVPSDPLATDLAGPLQIDVGSRGQIYVAQDFAGIITKVRPNGTTKDIVTETGEVAGVASLGFSVVYTFVGGDAADPKALLKKRLPNGKIKTIANFSRFEKKHNPDGNQLYGFRNLTPACAAMVPPEIGGEPYKGIVESHPYAVANAPGGGWFVADAAANDILKVKPNGKIEVVNVLRPRKTIVTEEAATALGLPDCTVGKTYAFEPVPTDVEVSPLGQLIVSLLPGGPEDATLGARGAVLRISPFDGEWTVLGDGFLGATNVAVRPGGKIYVAELFANRISLLKGGVVTPVLDVPSPAALEWANGKLYASIDALTNGSIVTIKP